jgi:integrase
VFPTTAAAVKKAFERAVERAEIKNLHFYDLRHEASSRLAERLNNVLELSAVTGHKTLPTLKRCYHPKAQDLAKKLG